MKSYTFKKFDSALNPNKRYLTSNQIGILKIENSATPINPNPNESTTKLKSNLCWNSNQNW